MSKAEPRGLRLRVAPGLERAAHDELAERGLESEIEPGGLVLSTDALHEVLLWSRIGSAVTRRMGTVSPDKLPDGLASMGWRRVLRRGQRIDVRLVGFNVRGMDKKVAAVLDRLGDPGAFRGRPPPARVLLVKRSGRVEVVLEAARDLYKRGWRRKPGRAPIRENLASGLLRVAGWRPDEVLVDPMCGSGTFPVEAALRGLGRAPGAWRSFAAESWPSFDTRAFGTARRGARESGRGEVRIHASDRNPRQLDDARANAATARVDRHVRFARIAFEELEPPADAGLVVMNPPYGQRLSATEATYRFIGDRLARAWTGWRYGVIVPDRRWVRFLPRHAEVSAMVESGGRKIWFAVGRV